MSRPMSTSPVAASHPGAIDTQFESMIDFSEFDTLSSYRSPSLSPSASQKASFAARPPAIKPEPTANSLLPAGQSMSGPSHQYDLYKQQTGIVPGSLATTIAVNQNAQIQGYNPFTLDYLGLGGSDDGFDFNTVPSGGDMDLEFDPASPDNSFFLESTVNPTTLAAPESLPSPGLVPTQNTPAGRMWPGIHQQNALAKAQAQQRQQQQIGNQQQQQQQQLAKPPSHKSKPSQGNDPLVEQKISQLLNSMRARASADGLQQNGSVHGLPRARKDEDDMDEDERLLASEEGKKLSSKERRQLRNKVSARAFRSRRKEYITQLEAEIATKVTENGDLRAQNRALVDENKRLSDLTRMLLSSPSFSNFLDNLSANPQQLPQSVPQQQQQQQPQSAIPKDVYPYASQHQQIGVATVPDQPMGPDGFVYQPQVYAVLSTPEPPAGIIDTAALSGKTSNFVGCLDEEDDDSTKMEVSAVPSHLLAAKVEEPAAPVSAAMIDEEFESDPEFTLYHEEPTSSDSKSEQTSELQQQQRELDLEQLDASRLSQMDLFGGVEPEKALARFELVDPSEEEASVALAMERVQRVSAALEDIRVRLEAMTVGL